MPSSRPKHVQQRQLDCKTTLKGIARMKRTWPKLSKGGNGSQMTSLSIVDGTSKGTAGSDLANAVIASLRSVRPQLTVFAYGFEAETTDFELLEEEEEEEMEVSALTRFMMAIGMGGPDVSCVQAVTIEVINRGPHAFIEARPRQDNAMVLLVEPTDSGLELYKSHISRRLQAQAWQDSHWVIGVDAHAVFDQHRISSQIDLDELIGFLPAGNAADRRAIVRTVRNLIDPATPASTATPPTPVEEKEEEEWEDDFASYLQNSKVAGRSRRVSAYWQDL